MSLRDVGGLIDEREKCTTRTSEQVRTLSVAGIAIVWALKPERTVMTKVGPNAQRVVVALVLALCFDFLGNFVTGLLWDRKVKSLESKTDITRETPISIGLVAKAGRGFLGP